MSWNITSIGPRAAVKHVVNSNGTMPQSLKDAIVAILDEPLTYPSADKPNDSARVVGYGHSGGGYGSIGKLEVELFRAAELPAATS